MTIKRKRELTITRKQIANEVVDRFFRDKVREGLECWPPEWKWSATRKIIPELVKLKIDKATDHDKNLFVATMYQYSYMSAEFIEVTIMFNELTARINYAFVTGHPFLPLAIPQKSNLLVIKT